jgi:dihydrofolate reductase
MRVSIVAAISENGVIGRDGGLPWRISSDLRRFKQLTMGHHLVMGRKTFQSIGRTLPGRTTLVLTRNGEFQAPGVIVACDLDEALDYCRGDGEVFIVGGAEVYRQALPRAQRLYLTEVHARVDGDAFFPQLDRSQWRLAEEQRQPSGEKDEYASDFRVFDRIQNVSQEQ